MTKGDRMLTEGGDFLLQKGASTLVAAQLAYPYQISAP
jgi:hypothetical protein